MTGRRVAFSPLGALAVAIAGAIVWLVVPAAEAQAPPMPAQPDLRFAGLQWGFVRVHYTAWTMPPQIGQSMYDEPWYIDAPAADWNLSRRVRTATAIQVNDPIDITLEDPTLFQHPWIYIVEGGNLRLKDAEVAILREFLLRGGTLTFDDFHGPVEWANVEHELKRVFPERQIIDLPPEHPVFSCFYKMNGFPQTPGLGSFLQGRTWEKGGYVAHLRAIEDNAGRAMVLINWNTDMGDGWEWSNAADYPGYVKYTAQAYRMEINEIVYSLTH
ncbi:MAG: transmembrane prediction [Acidobacteria bacterium]|nr:MAG: transmembrane prediction [Acidobacteriota bacterium]